MWQQLKIQLKSEHASALEQTLIESGALSISYLDAEDQPVFQREPGSTPLWDNTFLLCLFDENAELDSLLSDLKRNTEILNNESLAVEVIEDQDWERSWMADFQAMQFGENLWIYPSWQSPPDPNAANIKLDPGLAFGSGTHTTTSLCLRWLGTAEVKDKEVIDYGCGSGVLAIGAAVLGADKVHAVDNDPQAIAATMDNSYRNNIPEEVITVYLPEALPELQADILIANILAEPLLDLSVKFADLVKKNGHIALSGILEEQIPTLLACYQRWFEMDAPVIEKDWVLLTGMRKA
ncbi:MAG: 50S ribosomal protein L11 methyltransferase [Gammaproteobacteria bacterium]|nr:50S ribosomal protein L11 methyltransferase [Gammaproteobacteria bacterium]MDD9897309.1 50S ribosomal protein L11 methyltransferase [Gammaproteobacteria bacterium]MDD9959445.1 50S ribosomal protein L11 methyltransferase [Gammaproteobacteria bacterium]